MQGGSPRQLLLPLSIFVVIIVVGAAAGWNPWACGTVAALLSASFAAIAQMIINARMNHSRDDEV